MPKLGAKPDDRPYNTRCVKCGCIVEKLIERFNLYGKGVKHQYRCANPYHNCGTVQRDGCEPRRAYDEPIVHQLYDGAGGLWEHPGPVQDCEMPDCADRGHKAVRGEERHPGRYTECTHPDCEPPF